MILTPETDIYIRIPDDSGVRTLLPGHVIASDDESITVRLEKVLEFEEGQELFLHYQINRQFLQQPAQVVAPGDEDNAEHDLNSEGIRFLVTGEPFSAENREDYRVSALASGIVIDTESESGCKVLDVSGTGFSFYAQSMYDVGTSLTVQLTFDDQRWTGTIVIMSAQSKRDKMRYGVRATDGAIKNEMNRICLGVERQQLQRLAVR